MSVARPVRSLLGRGLNSKFTSTTTTAAAATPAIASHALHTSAPCAKRHKLSDIRPKKGSKSSSNLDKYTKDTFPEYTKEDKEALRTKYSPQHMEAIELGEKAVSRADLLTKARLRDDPFRPSYIEDYTVLDPRYDLKPDLGGTPQEPVFLKEDEWMMQYGKNLSSKVQEKMDVQMAKAMIRALKTVKLGSGQDMIDLTVHELEAMEKDPELARKYIMDNQATDGAADAKTPKSEALNQVQMRQLDEAIEAEWRKELERLGEAESQVLIEPSPLELMQDGPAGESRIHSAEAHELGKVPGVEGLYMTASDSADEGHDDSGKYQELKRLTGMSLREILSLTNKVLVRRRVVNQTRLGKIQSWSIVAIAGNGDGRLGLGIAKSTEARLAAETARMLAIRNMKPIRRYENRTIYGNVKTKISGTVIDMYARPAGFGLRCPHRIFEMCRAVGIHDIHVRMPRSTNPLNSVKAAYEALMNQVDPERIAIGRGKKLVDARKVYYGGSV